VTHLSEERNIPATAAQVWRVVADTKRWPQFYATPKERLHLRSVEFLDGATVDGPDVKRRLHFLGVPSWDEQATKWREDEFLMWLGIRNPGQKYWTQQMEIIPGKGFCTLRWDIFYSLHAPRPVKKAFKRTMEDLMLASLARIEGLVLDERKSSTER
jgi:hypothetical protein